MTTIWPQGDPLTVQATEEGEPAVLHWRGTRHPVERIVDRWRVDTGWWDDTPLSRAYFTLTTSTGLLVTVFCDTLTAEWKLVQLYE